jgi:hypothetical protein
MRPMGGSQLVVLNSRWRDVVVSFADGMKKTKKRMDSPHFSGLPQ